MLPKEDRIRLSTMLNLTLPGIFYPRKIEILHDPDFALRSKYQHHKLWCMANKIYKNKKILYVCFEVNRKNIFNLSFCLVIVNAPKNNQRFDEMASKYC